MIALAGFVYGLIAAVMFRCTADPRRIRCAANRTLAHIMEFRLFIDEPALVWRAQKDALRANLRLLRQIALPCAAMAAIFAILWSPLDRTFGREPLRAGQATVMTSHSDRVPEIPGIVIETPGVRIPRTGEVSWRIRPVRAVSGGFPAGVEVVCPRNASWLLWFFVFSSAGALAGAWKR
jgi:hypothetical protein